MSPLIILAVLVVTGPVLAYAQEATMSVTDDTAAVGTGVDDADAPQPESIPSWRDDWRVRGYLWSEGRYMDFAGDSLGQLVASRMPERQAYFEGNLDLRWSPQETVAANLDASALYLTDTGARLWLRESNVEANPGDWRFVLGKSRVTYSLSAGLSPADLLNPPRDPAQPEIQAEGAWMALAQMARDNWAVSAIFSPQVKSDTDGLPQFARAEAADFRAVLRGYVNLWDTDLNLMLYWLNAPQNTGCCQAYALSTARVIGRFELHGEATVARYDALGLLGSAQALAVPTYMSASGLPPAAAARLAGLATEAPQRPAAQDWQVLGLLGGRYMSDSNQMALLEYYYNSAGLTVADRQSVARMIWMLQSTQRAYPDLDLASRMDAAGLRNRDGVLGRHLLVASWTWAELRDYYTPRLVWQQSLDDGSFMAFAALDARLADPVLLTLGAAVPVGAMDTEFGMTGLDWRGFGRLTFYF